MNNTLTRTICCKLDVHSHEAMAATQRAFNEAATWIARVCCDEGITTTTTTTTTTTITAHHRVYGETRLAYGLGAQLAVGARAKAVEPSRLSKRSIMRRVRNLGHRAASATTRGPTDS